jgi:hypothetical protein
LYCKAKSKNQDFRKTSAISKGPADQKANLICFTYKCSPYVDFERQGLLVEIVEETRDLALHLGPFGFLQERVREMIKRATMPEL